MPAGVWLLGVVSLFMDLSSEMIHALLPVFLVSVLGASVAAVGLLEGAAEAIAAMTKVFSGVLSDRLRKRKLLTVLGYGLAAVTKPVFALATSTGWVFAARAVDRVGKGIRGAPRDALIADLVPAEGRGAAFGLRQALDTVGAFAGPLLAIALMASLGDFRAVFWIAVVPAAVSVLVLVLFVREPAQIGAAEVAAERPTLRVLLGGLSAEFWWLVTVAALFTFARFSEAFLILKSSELGLRAAYVPAVLVVMNLAYALSAYPAGWLSDRMKRWSVFAVGAGLLIGANVVLAFAASLGVAALGVVLWGLHMGCTQGLLAALVADAAAPQQRGKAFGVFNFVTGVALLAASALAGVLWDLGGPRFTFLAGAALTAAAGLVALVLRAARKIDGTTS